jgi:hypothetical protein
MQFCVCTFNFEVLHQVATQPCAQEQARGETSVCVACKLCIAQRPLADASKGHNCDCMLYIRTSAEQLG